MNLLYDAFPETVQVDDVSYAVYTDFRNWLRFFDMMADEAYTAKEKFLAIGGQPSAAKALLFLVF